jgi:hypothetical protein
VRRLFSEVPPVRFQQSLAHESKQRGIERALFDQQGSAGNLPDAQEDALAVERPEGDGLQDEEIEGAGKDLSAVGH